MSPHLATAGLAILLAAVAVADVRTYRIPDWLNALIILSGLAATWLLGRDLIAALIGVAAGYAALWLVNFLFRAVRGKDGLGLGDAKLLAGAGAWLGWHALPFVVLTASILGLAYVGLDRLRGRAFDGARKLPFGPYLCLGVFAMWIVELYF
ncbi:MAG: prepilin peptidase [Hyphomonadaceae bacterium]|nr:prepilin peptidase [Hyphomonadaceae bacterium]